MVRSRAYNVSLVVCRRNLERMSTARVDDRLAWKLLKGLFVGANSNPLTLLLSVLHVSLNKQ